MPISIKPTPSSKAQIGSKVRQAQYALEAAARVRLMHNCLFSLVPEDDLVRQAANWYSAYTEGALRFNTVLIKQWVRVEAAKAMDGGFALEDFLELLRCFRQSAIDVERWNENGSSLVDRIINETLVSLRGSSAWPIADGLNYLTSDDDLAPFATDTQILDKPLVSIDKRNAGRCQLNLPIRIRTKDAPDLGEEITKTANVSRTGLSFVTTKDYLLGAELLVVYPYWAAEDSFNEEYLARVVRKSSLREGVVRVAIQFLVSLGRKTDPTTKDI
jgi:hypothetical protein